MSAGKLFITENKNRSPRNGMRINFISKEKGCEWYGPGNNSCIGSRSGYFIAKCHREKARLMTREIYCIYLYSRKGKLECSSHDNKRSYGRTVVIERK